MLTAALAAAVVSPARAEVVAREQAATSVAAWGSYAAWSRYEGRRFRLIVWHGGRARHADVAPRGAAFDVDLGVDRRGRVVAVYSRCARYDRQQLRTGLPIHVFNARCDLYEYDVAARRERRLARPSRRARSEFLPAIDRGRLVFARGARRGVRIPELVSATFSPYREQRLPRPGGRQTDVADGGNRGPTAIDATDGLAVVGWQQVPPRTRCDSEIASRVTYQVLAYALKDRGRRTLDDDCDSDGEVFYVSPSLSAGRVFYAFSPGADPLVFGVRRFDLATGAHADGPPARPLIVSTQTGGDWTWTVRDVVINRRHTFEVARDPAA
ncbi:hypothetical protein OJ997_00175 [Solirubrobacter phytolaccae]|uniref:Uncharacterized protein n=1 Tax=Solirubrobacter phytolaccae TaxID=1404360 RepID=A0A9X3N2T5_9ACTN|nr:hypothetical protein [Solirubrobacter phytolaccae]MDA0178693.1 hypothetical protein [Solirubrobacter phytolaccae]